MNSINERSTATLNLRFASESGKALVPDSGRYQVSDEMTGTVLCGWTDFTPATNSYNIVITQDINQIIDDSHDSEVRVVSVIFQYSSTKQATGVFKYEVVNLHSVPPTLELVGSSGVVTGGAGVFG